MNPFAAKIAAARAAAASPEAEVKQAVHESLAEIAAQDAIIEQHIPPETISVEDERVKDARKLSQLVDEKFPFDESQLAAIYGMACERYACMTGAAGTGKTTSLKKLIDTLLAETNVDYIDMNQYFKKGDAGKGDDDEYEMPSNYIPSVCLVSFTGKATQQIKKNFPRDWHSNIMTIHRCLAFVPDYYEEWDEETESMRKKMRFIPTYNADLLLPWDIIVIDEGGMTGLELWHQLWAACKPGCRIYMVGDINQLPPVHGRSIFGFAMANWPSFELTHIHRQQGVNNPIVDNAWRILKGQTPKAEGAFQMIEVPGEAGLASRKVKAIIPKLKEMGIYEPNRDTIITAINGLEGSRGAQLGQLPLNNEFSVMFNPQSEQTRYFIDAGRERKMFAVGDKVMATKNDHEAGITNGMTGIITDINPNGAWAGDWTRYGPIQEVNEYMRQESEEVDDGAEFTLEELNDTLEAVDQGVRDAKDKRDRGPASHIVTVRFGDADHGFELPFATLSEVGSLQTAYVVTCHKMQGGESPTVIIICHDSHRQMLYREWLYTAVTRASVKCILIYSKTALSTALNKQNIKGSTLRQKVEAFNALQRNNGLGVAVSVTLPIAERLYEPKIPPSTALVFANPSEIVDAEFSPLAVDDSEVEPETSFVREEVVESKPEVHIHTGPMHVHETHIHVHVKQQEVKPPTPPKKSLAEMLAKSKAGTHVEQGKTWNEVIQQNPQLALPAPAEKESHSWMSAEEQSLQMQRNSESVENSIRSVVTENTTPVESKPLSPLATLLAKRKIQNPT